MRIKISAMIFGNERSDERTHDHHADLVRAPLLSFPARHGLNLSRTAFLEISQHISEAET
jgi:hypothetical protein